MAYLAFNVALKEDFISSIREYLKGLESRMKVMEVLLGRLLNDERKTNDILDALLKEEVSKDVMDAEYELGVVKSYTRDLNKHLIDYMLLLTRNIKRKKEFLNTVIQ
ncbi:unnamed protein product [Lactuca virosa]|uniref:Uncharacterized protein n=1 Tax=Lactuca virosa TaxID=75947 RepID=A0AAU9P1H9_9ASTR|nr:unnamed protein product [Lactuca virosa]